MASSASPAPSLWETKRRVEQAYPDFPHFDISAPDFDHAGYTDRLINMLADAGIPMQPYSTTWNNLTCTVPVEPPNVGVTTVISGLQSCFTGIRNGFASLKPHRQSPEPLAPSDILSDVSGYLKPGQLCLVLGPSGSGTSLLLSRIAGRPMPKLIESSGTVLYQGEERFAGVARLSHFINFVGQEDVHFPQLTVRNTLEFAARCKWPAWVPHVDVIRRNDVILTAKTLRIENTMETIVGSTILRGVSGGERKRVTIGEMFINMVGGVLVMDNWSKGLDSATTLSITQSVKNFASQTKSSVITCMQAPGSEVYNEFDTLCLMHEGRQLYFGPADQAEAYFNTLGFYRPSHRTVPDFLSTVMEPVFRKDYTRADGDKPVPPTTAEEFAACFNESHYAADMRKTIGVLNETKLTVKEESKAVLKRAQKRGLQKSRYQLRALMSRQKNYLLSTRNVVLQDFMQNLIFGLLLGSIFWQLPNTLGGAGSRAGVVFLAMLFIALGSLGKVQDRFDEKDIFTKQRNASFFTAGSYLLTQAVFDVILELIKSLCMIVPLYIMAGLHLGSSNQRLLYAVLVTTITSNIMVSLTRTFAGLLEDPSAAQGACGLFATFLILFTGFMKNGNDLDKYLVWIYWANPLHYAFEVLIINEFDGLNFDCASDELLPSASTIINEQFSNLKRCFHLPSFETGKAYLETYLGITNGKEFRAYYFLVLVAFYVLFFILSAIATATSRSTGHLFKKAGDDEQGPEVESSADATVDVAAAQKQSTAFTFTDITYTVENGSKVLLPGITGNTVSGKVTLLIGTSGAGKTTLLDVCAMRKTLGRGTSMSGEIRVNGEIVDQETLALYTGYCEQNDMHAGEATVFEAVLFSANLRLPVSMGDQEKRTRTMDTLVLLGLERFAHVLVKALGAGELKLLTMALEVVTDPKVLFLDEPTSGISSSSALTVARALRKIADHGTAVVCTLHQPSKEVFSMFDRVLLLKRGGKTVYFGDIGENARTLRGYFEARGAHRMREEENPAAWMLDVVGSDDVDWPELWSQSEERVTRNEETAALTQVPQSAVKGGDNDDDAKRSLERPGISTQVSMVIHRQFLLYWRSPDYNGTRVMLNLFMALFIGILFLRDVGTDQRGSGLAFAALFLTLIPSSISAVNVIPKTMAGRDVFYREVASGTYQPLAYHAAVGVVEIPFTLFSTAVFAVVFYFMVGLDPARFGYFFLSVQLIYLMSVMYGIALSAVLPTVQLASTIENAIYSILMVLSGFFLRKSQMRPWWKWTTWLNPFSYYLSGVLHNQFSGQDFTCEPEQRIPITRPPGFDNCTDIEPWFENGVLDNGTATCTFCMTPNGDAVIEQFGAGDVNKWLCLVAIVVATTALRILAGYGFAKKRFLVR